MIQPDPKSLVRASKKFLRSLPTFAERGTGIRLRPYQAAPIPSILASIDQGFGLSFVIIYPRQSGKDELIASLKAYLMTLLSPWEHSIVEVNPTYKPQTINAIMRLETRLNMNPITLSRWRKRSDFIRQVGLCRASFLSGDGQANVVGATASLLLIINEAQDIEPHIYDKKFAPMCASTNATRIFCGTVWTSTTLLAREMRNARAAQEKDGIQRLFIYNADDVTRSHKPYGKHVAGQIAALGRQNPMVKTQYFNEEIDAESGMFNAARLALMQADRSPAATPLPSGEGRVREPYAFLIDAAGQDEARMSDPDSDLLNAARDSVTLSICSIDTSTVAVLKFPTYRIIHRQAWTGLNHLDVFGRLKALIETWQPQYIVIDATGVGEGLWSLLDRFFPTRVIPVKFTQQAKSEIGWMFISVIETGRFRNCETSATVDQQYAACQSEILPGPAKTLRWGVPDGARDPATGELIHDDYLMADALCTQLDKLDWHIPYKPFMIHAKDPLDM